ncbi:MAG: type II toxin-antitoxin system RelE/ParE family toxin [Trichocoleus desertorum ATA4-8-CV12]|jgi:mRNA-degrading endonuclease RelE of RelBE toxin-antitoxin system|nr:type II toxin-antitoxin system RelE/ParE family toxin [Trichocoleus desertorum ATA4-8-CV12]
MQNEPPDQTFSEPIEEQDGKFIVQIELTPEFQQNLRKLAKRYRNIRFDIQPVIQEIQVGNLIGDRLTNIGKDYRVFKVRIQNRDIQKGKSAGYRLIYQVESSASVLLLTIYSKSDRDDISADEVRGILNEFYTSD